jgi:hypothetical protein
MVRGLYVPAANVFLVVLVLVAIIIMLVVAIAVPVAVTMTITVALAVYWGTANKVPGQDTHND